MKKLEDQIKHEARQLQEKIWDANKIFAKADACSYRVEIIIQDAPTLVVLDQYSRDYTKNREAGRLEYSVVQQAIDSINVQVKYLYSIGLKVKLVVQSLGHRRQIKINTIILQVFEFKVERPKEE